MKFNRHFRHAEKQNSLCLVPSKDKVTTRKYSLAGNSFLASCNLLNKHKSPIFRGIYHPTCIMQALPAMGLLISTEFRLLPFDLFTYIISYQNTVCAESTWLNIWNIPNKNMTVGDNFFSELEHNKMGASLFQPYILLVERRLQGRVLSTYILNLQRTSS